MIRKILGEISGPSGGGASRAVRSQAEPRTEAWGAAEQAQRLNGSTRAVSVKSADCIGNTDCAGAAGPIILSSRTHRQHAMRAPGFPAGGACSGARLFGI